MLPPMSRIFWFIVILSGIEGCSIACSGSDSLSEPKHAWRRDSVVGYWHLSAVAAG